MKKPLKDIEQVALLGAMAANTKAIEANTQALRELDQIKRSLATMDAHKNLIPALCHSLDRLQAEFSALRLQANPKKRGKAK